MSVVPVVLVVAAREWPGQLAKAAGGCTCGPRT